MPIAHVTLEQSPDTLDVQTIRDGLAAFNLIHAEDDGHRALTAVLRAGNHMVVGGLIGVTYWGWLHIDTLWVSESFRSLGFGKRMLETAEQEARQRGCRNAHLDTMSFQGRTFYERHGYTVFGELTDLPPGHSRIFMRKSLR